MSNILFCALLYMLLPYHLLFKDHSDAGICLTDCSILLYLNSPSFSVTLIPMGVLNVALLLVPASLIFILDATITAALLWPFI